MSEKDSTKQDLLYGVPYIADHLNMTPAQVYHLASIGRLPTFKVGRKVCARRSALDQWLADCEAAALKGGDDAGRDEGDEPAQA